ncbi:PREDICTED: uncharacterized protein LOC108566244 [Nicrophorus vespilloides]|uniref:Uncharacterized protein LOC108566244 n=1 Tax=Nicrophorus vespilloides TaxID=110193 RepID=A0ABM1N3Y1_NICVS|nr:PREDICTED: uncharacterized protein LOC108566244 [Nicrophorus vespilloides]
MGETKRRALEKIKYFAQNTTIHGVPLIAAPRIHPLERLFWVLIVVAAISGAVAVALKNVSRYYANPTVVSLQKDFRNWFNPFPSATACFIHKADDILIDEYIEEKWGLNDTHPRYDYYRDFILAIANISYGNMHVLARYRNDPQLNDLDYIELAARVHPELTGTLVTFDPNAKTDWKLVITELGICFSVNIKYYKFFTFNVKGVNSSSSSPSDEDEILKCHYLNGLCYARYDSDPLAPLKIYIHSYYDIAHATSEQPLHVKESEELEINYRMQETIASVNLRYLLPSQRQCRFDDEPINSDIPAYSASICYISCRYRLVLKLCGCKPFFYNNLPGKVCDLKGMQCVAKYSELITGPPIKLGCNCPQPCDLITYLPQVPKITVWEYGYFDQRITFRWGLLPPTTKYHRDVLFGFEDLVGKSKVYKIRTERINNDIIKCSFDRWNVGSVPWGQLHQRHRDMLLHRRLSVDVTFPQMQQKTRCEEEAQEKVGDLRWEQ